MKIMFFIFPIAVLPFHAVVKGKFGEGQRKVWVEGTGGMWGVWEAKIWVYIHLGSQSSALNFTLIFFF